MLILQYKLVQAHCDCPTFPSKIGRGMEKIREEILICILKLGKKSNYFKVNVDFFLILIWNTNNFISDLTYY